MAKSIKRRIVVFSDPQTNTPYRSPAFKGDRMELAMSRLESCDKDWPDILTLFDNVTTLKGFVFAVERALSNYQSVGAIKPTEDEVRVVPVKFLNDSLANEIFFVGPQAEADAVLADMANSDDVFEYGGYHFQPYRYFRDGEIHRWMESDTSSMKLDMQFAMRNLSTDETLGMRNYNNGKIPWSSADFLDAADDRDEDIFRCVETGKLYVPGDNELYRYEYSR